MYSLYCLNVLFITIGNVRWRCRIFTVTDAVARVIRDCVKVFFCDGEVIFRIFAFDNLMAMMLPIC